MKYLNSLFILTIIFSCSKNESKKIVENNCNNIMEVYDYHPFENPIYQNTATLTYNSDGKIKNIVGQRLSKAEYTYYNDSIVLKATSMNGMDNGQVYYLDNLQRITRKKYGNEDFQYNSEGYLISYKKPYEYNGQILGYAQYFLVWQSGNLIRVYTNDQNASIRDVVFEYYNLPNQNLLGYNSPFYYSNILYDRNSFYLLNTSYYGKQSKDLLKSSIINGIYNQATDIIYQSDATARIISLGYSYKFKYQCP